MACRASVKLLVSSTKSVSSIEPRMRVSWRVTWVLSSSTNAAGSLVGRPAFISVVKNTRKPSGATNMTKKKIGRCEKVFNSRRVMSQIRFKKSSIATNLL